ncbi:hypothetical protein C0993_010832 [Termitomyces sp. T159_Od127]|nr:hypothetical protein C0993_010832 [Termitomyces sp. T159_Od127]
MSSLQSSHHVHDEMLIQDDESTSYSVWALSDDASEHHPTHSRREGSRPPQPSKNSELTQPPNFRILRQSPKLPPQPSPTSTSTQSAISASYNTRNINSNCEDVPSVVNSSAPYLSSPVTRTDALAHYLGPSVSSSPNTPLNHVLTLRRPRPRTSNQVFTAPHGKIAPHGIPKSLPPAPSTAPRRTQPAESTYPDFAVLSQNYIKMLKQTPTDNTLEAAIVTAELATQNSTISPEQLQSIMDVITGEFVVYEGNYNQSSDISSASSSSSMAPPPTPQTPELSSSSPAFSEFNDFFSPDADFLNTPVIEDSNDAMLTGMFTDAEFEGGMLFPSMNCYGTATKEPEPSAPGVFDNLITMTPESPFIDDFTATINPSSLHCSPPFPADMSSFPSPAPVTQTIDPVVVRPPVMDRQDSARRRSSATGTRKGVTPEALVPVDAPTQPRKYVLPSATSRKELPSVFAKKRSRSTAFGEEDDELNEAPPGPDASEREQIEYKRRQNTVAARRSRKRKLEYQQNLEASVERLTRERDVWKTRATMLHEMLQSHGVSLAPFQDLSDEI